MKNETVTVLYEDDDLICVAKPAGTLTIPDRYDKRIPNLFHLLEDAYGKIFVVHRLDRDTSGVVIFAKTPEAHRELNEQFMNQTLTKIYHAVLQGVVSRDSIDIDIPIAADQILKGRSRPSARGKESLSRLRVLERYRNATLVEVDLVSGRHHQLRVHVSAIGHPLLIDDFYGTQTEFFVSSIKKRYNLKKHEEEIPLIDRITMHAYSIEFDHPTSGDRIKVVADYPKDFAALVSVLRKYSMLKSFFAREEE